jgi:hypothetical protein
MTSTRAMEALVQLTLERGDAGTVASFEAAVVELPQARHAERLFGDPDYLLRVVPRTSTASRRYGTRSSPRPAAV